MLGVCKSVISSLNLMSQLEKVALLREDISVQYFLLIVQYGPIFEAHEWGTTCLHLLSMEFYHAESFSQACLCAKPSNTCVFGRQANLLCC